MKEKGNKKSLLAANMIRTTVIEPMFIAYMICHNIVGPLKEQFFYHKVCIQKYNASFCDVLSRSINEAFKDIKNGLQKETTTLDIYYNLIVMLPGIVSTMFFAIMIDRVSRKKVLSKPIIGATLSTLTLLLNAYYMKWPVNFVLIAGVLEGMTGQVLTMISATNAYVSDITSLETRTKRILFLESTKFLSGLIGYLTGGFITEKLGYSGTFIVMLCLYVFQVFYWIFLKETEIQEDDHTRKTKRQLFFELLGVTFKNRERGKRGEIILWSIYFYIDTITYCLVSIAKAVAEKYNAKVKVFGGIGAVLTLYFIHINLSPSQIGYLLAEQDTLKFLGACFINYVLLHKLKWSESRILVIFFTCLIAEQISIANSNTLWKVILAYIAALGLGAGSGTMRGKLSKLVESNEQGKLFASVACIETILSFGSKICFRELYKETLDISASINFYVFAGLALIPLLMILKFNLQCCRGRKYKAFGNENGDENYDNLNHPINS